MVEPKTVSNLPLDVSIRWSEDQEFLVESKKTSQDATLVSSFAETGAILPTKVSEFDALLGLAKLHPSWATFQTPPDFFHQRRQIFRTQLIPFLGTDEQQDAMISRLQNAKGDENDQDTWEREKGYMLKLYQLFQTLNKDLIDILNRCKEYSKG